MNFKIRTVPNGRVKKIPFWTIEESHTIWVRVKRRKKLTDLYPQRSILEESRKDSTLGKANDWIDHDYYERLVEEADRKNAEMVKKHSPKVIDSSSDGEKVSTPITQVKTIENPLFNRIPR